MNSTQSPWPRRLSPWRNWLIGLGSLTLLTGLATPALAADRIFFTYGPIGRSIPIGDLRDFADNGTLTRQLRWYLNFAGVEPEALRQVLTREVGLNLRLVDRIGYSIPGEYVLFQVGQVVHTKSRIDSVQIKALRSALIVSTADDNKISLLEFLERYPTPEVYVDGVVLARAARNVSNFIETIEPTLAVIQEFLAGLICDCQPNSPNPRDSSPP
jgi:hypothetical protein